MQVVENNDLMLFISKFEAATLISILETYLKKGVAEENDDIIYATRFLNELKKIDW